MSLRTRGTLCFIIVFAAGCDELLAPRVVNVPFGVAPSATLLQLSADVIVTGDERRVRLHVANTGSQPVTFHYGLCSTMPRLYTTRGRPVAWDPAELHSCPDIALSSTLAPHTSGVLTSHTLIEAPSGRYHVTLTGVLFGGFEVSAGVHRLP